MNADLNDFKWTRQPKQYTVKQNEIEIVSNPFTDLWQTTYYNFKNDNAPVFQTSSSEQFFSFVVKTDFEAKHRFDQCGVVVYLDSENWIKASVEYENETFSHLGSVVTNNGYSDWATTEIPSETKTMWYRLSRRQSDFKIECSTDGQTFKQLRICHMFNAEKTVSFGIYACSPENSSFSSTFSNLEITECRWLAHDGQQPD